MKPISLAYYAVALFAPIIYFTVLTPNTNETNPLAVWIACPVLFAIAGYLSCRKFVPKAQFKWIGTSIIAGFIEAGMLVWMA